jgi:hypothetical protein
MRTVDINRIFELNGIEKNIYLFCVTDEQISKEDYISYTYHIKHKFVEFMRSKSVEYCESSIKKALGSLKKAGFMKAGGRRGDYLLNYEK